MNENFYRKCANILKGEQPEKTNCFLQLFYKATTNGKDNSPLIQKYLEKRAKKKKKKAEPAITSNFGNESKKVEKRGKIEKHNGMISEGGKDLNENESYPTDNIKIG